MNPRRQKLVLEWARVGTIVLFCGLLAQFFRLQVLEHERWKRRAEGQHFFVVKEPFRRGTFFSNTSVQLGQEGKRVAFAIDVPLYHLYADPKSIPQPLHTEIRTAIVKVLAPPLKENTKLAEELRRHSRSRRLVSWVTEQQKAIFLSWWRPFAKKHKLASNGLFFVSDYKRFHPMGRLLGQVLHTIQERRDEVTGKAMPTGGLELSMNRYLEGSVGFRRLMRSPHNSLETGDVLQQPLHGADVELTINHCLQAIVEDELEKGVTLARAKRGVAIMVEPRTGHILALAQYPFFTPDQYQDYFNNPLLSEHAKICALSDAPEPGSPTKAFTVALALKANRELAAVGKPPLFTPLEKISTSSGIFPGRSKPLPDTHFHKALNMYMGVQKSSNIYMATLASRVMRTMGEKWYRNELEQSFGFGRKTGVELAGESAGMLPQIGKVNAAGKMEWSKGTPYTLAIGYNLQLTGLQLARAYCAIANGGVLPELTLIRKIFAPQPDRRVLVDNTTQDRVEKFPRVLHSDDVAELVRALKFVTKPGGSAIKADIYGYTEAGKTGTSEKLVNGQYSHNLHYSRFVGFAPVKNPAFVLYIGLDEPWAGYIPGRGLNHRGGTCATPIFREIGRRTLEFLGVPMDDPFGFPAHDPRSDPRKADYAVEIEKLNQLYSQWNQ